MCAISVKKGPNYRTYVKLLHVLGMPFGVAMLKTKSTLIRYTMIILTHVMAIAHVIYFITVKAKKRSSITSHNVLKMFEGLRAIATLIMVMNRNTYRNSQVKVAAITFDIEKRFLGKL
ncbi:unnamed protein product [Acanthoscelides obtectus]|uniref:Uncharacterized protein n=1 Tax=Acanthoscelides obtectus TaxID=200917 RepID=A0A9P0L977_ACAOB|nr:unnamed protein product [Acanthoscelides obtectus]CAK1670774.1 hypothetical protein AOBTE_LOCUS27822 [Acanthoscelides obtectus]